MVEEDGGGDRGKSGLEVSKLKWNKTNKRESHSNTKSGTINSLRSCLPGGLVDSDGDFSSLYNYMADAAVYQLIMFERTHEESQSNTTKLHWKRN